MHYYRHFIQIHMESYFLESVSYCRFVEPRLRSNMTNKFLPILDKIMQRKRYLIDTSTICSRTKQTSYTQHTVPYTISSWNSVQGLSLIVSLKTSPMHCLYILKIKAIGIILILNLEFVNGIVIRFNLQLSAMLVSFKFQTSRAKSLLRLWSFDAFNYLRDVLKIK